MGKSGKSTINGHFQWLWPCLFTINASIMGISMGYNGRRSYKGDRTLLANPGMMGIGFGESPNGYKFQGSDLLQFTQIHRMCCLSL